MCSLDVLLRINPASEGTSGNPARAQIERRWAARTGCGFMKVMEALKPLAGRDTTILFARPERAEVVAYREGFTDVVDVLGRQSIVSQRAVADAQKDSSNAVTPRGRAEIATTLKQARQNITGHNAPRESRRQGERAPQPRQR